MRGKFFAGSFILIASVWMFPEVVAAQTVSPSANDSAVSVTSAGVAASATKTAQKPASAATAQSSANVVQNNWTQQDETVSLGELARRHARKKAARQNP